jgi:hypothetical protein
MEQAKTVGPMVALLVKIRRPRACRTSVAMHSPGMIETRQASDLLGVYRQTKCES